MAVHYHLVLRKDMTKGAAEDSKLYYAQTSASGMNDLKQMCENIAARTTASEGDVKLVLDGFIYELKRSLQKGEVCRLDGLGSFQTISSSSGVKAPNTFTNT